MFSKRTFLKCSAVTTLMALSNPGMFDNGKHRERRINVPDHNPAINRVNMVLFDARYADSRLFAGAFSRYGIPAHPVGDDVGQFWRWTLRPSLNSQQTSFAGLSSPSDFFLLRVLARDTGLKPVYTGIHDCRSRSCLSHQLSLGKGGQDVVNRLLDAGIDWPVTLAGELVSMDLAELPLVHARRDSSAERRPDNPGMLVSWIFS